MSVIVTVCYTKAHVIIHTGARYPYTTYHELKGDTNQCVCLLQRKPEVYNIVPSLERETS